MSLVTLRDIMADANQNNYAVGSFNVINSDMIRGVILAAEQENSPAILSLAEVHCNFVSFDIIGEIMLKEAKLAKVPIAVHLDHGLNFSLIVKAMKLGFTSVMFDGSHLSFDGNVRQTKEIVKIAKALNISVEAELGKIDGYDKENDYTEPIKAKDFAEKTEIDALAVAFGTAHGIYSTEPILDLELLKKIKSVAAMPLVMHGGSGLYDSIYTQVINCGINKINYFTYLSKDVSDILRAKINSLYETGKNIYYHDISQWTIAAVKEHVANMMRVFRSSGKA